MLTIKTKENTENAIMERGTLPVVGPIHFKSPTIDGSTHWVTYLRQRMGTCKLCFTNIRKQHTLFPDFLQDLVFFFFYELSVLS